MGSPEKKVVLRLDLDADKAKQKAMKAVSTVPGIDSISMDMKDKKMTVIGLFDPVSLVSKLRKSWRTEILSIGPAKEPPAPEEKKDQEPKKEAAEPKEAEKKEEPKNKEEPKKEGEEPKQDEKKEEPACKKEEEPKKEAERKESEPKKEVERKDPNEQFAEFVKMYRFYYPYMTTRYAAAHSSVEEDPNPCTIL